MTDRADIRVTADDLRDVVRGIFSSVGVAPKDAAIWADVLVWANLRGVESHGVMRVPVYLGFIERGAINPKPNITVEKRAAAIALIEADRAPGPLAMTAAMEEAIGRAHELGVGWCAVRNMTHAGAIGYYALKAAERGMAGLAISASQPIMAYHGARVPSVSTNPLAIAVPGRAHRPLMLDMSTATAAFGKIMAAREAAAAIPEGWGLDAAGRPTTDPGAVETLLPLGGAKGAGLSLMIECLASLTAGFPLLARVLGGETLPGRPQNGAAIAVDIAALGDLEAFQTEVDRLAAAITGLPRAEGVEHIYAPGERGDAVLAERQAHGIPLPAATWDRLAAAAEAAGVPLPQPL